ncbi:MAG TPA: hypothetical protein VKB76_16825, partial [Ktedonobacterales bacterium]|nr:hypothetical protein [Ktedonobacterales bacterium]
NCGMQLGGPAAFCDTFDTAPGIGNRSGQLNGTIWGVSRWSGDIGLNPAYAFAWMPSTLLCNGIQIPVQPDNDIVICNGQLRESLNDNATGTFAEGNVYAITMYPKQPFNFANRTGTISFDVTNDTAGTHAAWPELWVTDTPRPTPFTHLLNVGGTIPANAFAIRFGAVQPPFQGPLLSPNCPYDNNPRWTIDSAVVVRNYIINDIAAYASNETYGPATNMTIQPLGCVIASTGADGGTNHVEVQVSQNQIDIYATDAGTTAPLVHIATITDANLTFTRGLVWLEDAHYNANKAVIGTTLPNQQIHTFAWDNLAFDGPREPRDLSFDVTDSLAPCHQAIMGTFTQNGPEPTTTVNSLCLGWLSASAASPMPAVNTMPMTAANIAAAGAQFIMFDAEMNAQPTTISLTVNGHA